MHARQVALQNIVELYKAASELARDREILIAELELQSLSHLVLDVAPTKLTFDLVVCRDTELLDPLHN